MAYRWFEFAPVERLQEGERLRVEIQGLPLCAVHLEGGTLMAFEDACPHHGVSLHDGAVVKADGTVTCGAHGWCFRLDTGECTEFSAYRLRRFPIAEEEGQLFVGLWLEGEDGPDPMNPTP